MQYRFLFLLAFSLGCTSVAQAQSAQQNVTVVVQEINAISVSAGSVTLTIATATNPGSNPDAVTNASTTYSLTTNGSSKKVAAELSAAYAAGIELRLSAAAPTGGASTGPQLLGTTAMDLVTGLTRVSASGMPLTYGASATVAVIPNSAGETNQVTFTVTNS